jgi:hypothetical protein
MTDCFLVPHITHREQDLEEHSIKRPFPFAFEPHTHFTGLQKIFIMNKMLEVISENVNLYF